MRRENIQKPQAGVGSLVWSSFKGQFMIVTWLDIHILGHGFKENYEPKDICRVMILTWGSINLLWSSIHHNILLLLKKKENY